MKFATSFLFLTPILALFLGNAAHALEVTAEKGPVSVVVRIEPDAPRIGDDLNLTLEVTAEAGVELLLPEYGEVIDRFSVVGYHERERVDDAGRTVALQEYTLQTAISGKQSIPEILIEFVDRRDGKKPHPDGEDAYELLTERLDFEIESILPADATPELKPALGTLPKIEPPAPPRWPWVLGVAAGLLIAAPFLVRGYLHWRRLARRRSAFDIARSRLEKLLGAPRAHTAETLDPFFVELSAIVRRYLENRFELRAPELTTEEFLDTVSGSPDLTSEHQRLLRDFLRGADLVKFAHVLPSEEDVESAVTSVRRFLDETRENAPLIDEPSTRENGSTRDDEKTPEEATHA